VDDLWATNSKDVGLIVCVVSFQEFQSMWSWYTNVTDGQTDGQTTCNRKTVLCTIVHRTVKTDQNLAMLWIINSIASTALCTWGWWKNSHEILTLWQA